MSPTDARKFYETAFRGNSYACGVDPAVVRLITGFVETYKLESKRVLEVGCGRGELSHLVADWTGVDLSASAGRGMSKPFICASAERLPFANGSFDAVWSIDVLEHVSDLAATLEEMARVVIPGGVILLRPAWYCRPWAADGYQVRAYKDLSWKGKLIKASIPLRNAVWYRMPGVAVRRLCREAITRLQRGPTRLHYRRLVPNYETFWQSDSDACNSLDPHDVILWFVSRGWDAVDRQGFWRRLLVRTGPIVFRRPLVLMENDTP
jgi:SAM-dependent methyltransferase